MAAVTVTVVMEEEEADNVGKETAGTDNKDDHGMRDILRFDEALNRFEEDGET